MPKNHISDSQRGAKHPFAGWNIQHKNVSANLRIGKTFAINVVHFCKKTPAEISMLKLSFIFTCYTAKIIFLELEKMTQDFFSEFIFLTVCNNVVWNCIKF